LESQIIYIVESDVEHRNPNPNNLNCLGAINQAHKQNTVKPALVTTSVKQ
jgi:hypothetical protein